MKQPDFTKIFADYFGAKPRKVIYELRPPPSFIHDLVFLSCLGHDATLKRSRVIIKGKTLIIPILRDCWELYIHDKSELQTANSMLKFSPVTDLEWIFKNNYKKTLNDDLMLDNIFVDLSYRHYESNIYTFYVTGNGWRLRFNMPDYRYKVKLQDLETPHKHMNRAT